MGVEGIIGVFGIVISIIAIANPIQRKSIFIFIPLKTIVVLFTITLGIVIWRSSVPLLGYYIFPLADLITNSIVIFNVILIFILSIVQWNRTKVSELNMSKFEELIITCKNEHKFDEIIRILNKNKSLSQFSENIVDLLYQPDILHEINNFPDWIALKLLEDNKYQDLKNINYISDNLFRDLLAKKHSIIKKYVVSNFGGIEYQNYTDYERELIERTIQNPQWYINTRADYPLLLSACEESDKESVTLRYNTNDHQYLNRQGVTTRIECPIFIFIKIHYLAIESAINNNLNEQDFYESDFHNIFREIINKMRYSEDIWNSGKYYFENPTPYYFLASEILYDLESLSDIANKMDNHKILGIGNKVFSIWYFCIYSLFKKSSSVRAEYLNDKISDIIVFILKSIEYNKKNPNKWLELFIDLQKKYIDNEFNNKLVSVTRNLDMGKEYIFKNYEMFINRVST